MKHVSLFLLLILSLNVHAASPLEIDEEYFLEHIGVCQIKEFSESGKVGCLVDGYKMRYLDPMEFDAPNVLKMSDNGSVTDCILGALKSPANLNAPTRDIQVKCLRNNSSKKALPENLSPLYTPLQFNSAGSAVRET